MRCKGCGEKLIAGEEVIVVNMGGKVPVHHKQSCIDRFLEKHPRYKGQLSTWKPQNRSTGELV